MSKALMVQGTTSDAGKSTLVAGLCRVLARQDVKVAPFKPQNMALNSAVTEDGGEIGRAQALQAIAANQSPRIDFNPILLKPSSDKTAQVIVQGKALTTLEAKDFWGKKGLQYKTKAMEAVLDSYGRLQQEFDAIIIEGAGSPAEINLREGDIANMGFAEAADCPVIIIADIDKGGVFAHLVGTLELLSESEQARVKGFVINRFRGEISLLQSGLDWLEQRTGKPVLGVLPYLDDLHLDAEDAIPLNPIAKTQTKLKVVVLVCPRISNHTDFEPLRLHSDIEFQYVRLSDDPANVQADLLILPGTKNVIEDLQALKASKWSEAIQKHLRYGGKVIGICGGYQMLGESISDPYEVETQKGEENGLGYLPIVTQLQPEKHLKNVSGHLLMGDKTVEVKGYEIHCGASSYSQNCQPVVKLSDGVNTQLDGVISSNGQILGTYLHGLFDQPQALKTIIEWAGLSSNIELDIEQIREQQLNRIADTIEEYCDMEKIQQVMKSSID
ncbi:cobyric acid synthase [Parashewanella tropica]|uniref:cobyric acid synthase n=1 Tax=Parashewanella tropica TaxID=2547970 RepID=UPI001FE256DB|nr:cobyric acid synthase [Parashewanella tropica]